MSGNSRGCWLQGWGYGFSRQVKIIKKSFASSDCKCLSYLLFIKDKKKTEKILREIGFSIFRSSLN